MKKTMKKTLKTFMYATPIVLTSFLGCEKENLEKDIIPPKINILSPLEGKTYYENIIPVQWEIEDDYFRGAWVSVNDKGRLLLFSKSGSINWYFKNGYNKVVMGADDMSSNASKDSTTFYIWSNLIKNNLRKQK